MNATITKACPNCGGTDTHEEERQEVITGDSYTAVVCDDCNRELDFDEVNWSTVGNEIDMYEGEDE